MVRTQDAIACKIATLDLLNSHKTNILNVRQFRAFWNYTCDIAFREFQMRRRWNLCMIRPKQTHPIANWWIILLNCPIIPACTKCFFESCNSRFYKHCTMLAEDSQWQTYMLWSHQQNSKNFLNNTLEFFILLFNFLTWPWFPPPKWKFWVSHCEYWVYSSVVWSHD